MKAVFLDRATFSNQLTLQKPHHVSQYTVFDGTPNDPKTIITRCQDADIIITNKVILTHDIITSLPKLKLIQLTATGMNNVDAKACQTQKITLLNVAGYAIHSVPEHVFMLMLNALRAGMHYHTQVIDGTWHNTNMFCLLDLPIFDLAGKTLGIIGRGSIGQKVGHIADAFGMHVLYAEHPNKPPRNSQYTDFNQVLKQADILSLNCPLTDETHHLINHQTISQMDKKPLIINTARGGVVDSHAIADAILNDKIFGYATDVFEAEPPNLNDPLLTLKNHPRVFFTPHNAWASLSAQQKLWEILCHQVDDFIRHHLSAVPKMTSSS